ncbi:Meiotic nuclear division protein 1-like protein [Microtus ochrogaster]|uniref:Meiotic nuclear division protein 1-like protein n=1 Tax=Microtus ochrogaster TaxID=79684 RepID=A0A8J6G1S5_MICOH|nr:Meiotic nuclear division protein 1-like protein [Microtus ochrogaster]
MSVKEVLQSLVDDGMVDCERIGTSNYYWAFPSKALHARTCKLEALNSQLLEGSQKHANLQKSIEKAKIGRQETEERAVLVKELSSFRNQRDQLKAEVEKYRECDPQVVEEIRQANKVAKEAANRWTETTVCLRVAVLSSETTVCLRVAALSSEITVCLRVAVLSSETTVCLRVAALSSETTVCLHVAALSPGDHCLSARGRPVL